MVVIVYKRQDAFFFFGYECKDLCFLLFFHGGFSWSCWPKWVRQILALGQIMRERLVGDGPVARSSGSKRRSSSWSSRMRLPLNRGRPCSGEYDA